MAEATPKRWLWFWSTVVSGWEPEAKQRIAEVFGAKCRAKAATGQVRFRVLVDDTLDSHKFCAQLKQLRGVGIEYTYIRLSFCSLARQRDGRLGAGARAPTSATAVKDSTSTGGSHEIEHEDGGDDEGDMYGHEDEVVTDTDDDGSGDDNANCLSAGADMGSAGGVEQSLLEGQQSTYAAASWRLTRIRQTSMLTCKEVLLDAIRLWRAHEGATQDEAQCQPLKFRVVAKRGGKGHDFSSDDVKRYAALGLVDCLQRIKKQDPTQPCNLEASLRDYVVSIRAQVHRKTFVLGWPLHSKAWVGHQSARHYHGLTSSDSALSQPTSKPTELPRPKNQGLGVVRMSSAKCLLVDWLSCRRAETSERPPDPTDFAKDIATPLWEMPYQEQVSRKQQEIGQVLKRIARKTRQLWIRQQQVNRVSTDASGANMCGNDLPEWLQPRESNVDNSPGCTDGNNFLEWPPLAHCGMELDAAWRLGYRNKLELTVGIRYDSLANTSISSACHTNQCASIGVGLQVSTFGIGMASKTHYNTSLRSKDQDSAMNSQFQPALIAPICEPGCTAVSSSQLVLAKTFSMFLQARSKLPIFEAAVGGHRQSAEGRGFWRGLTLRSSDKSGQILVLIRVNANYLYSEGNLNEELRDIWFAEQKLLSTSLSESLSPKDLAINAILLQYDGNAPVPIASHSVDMQAGHIVDSRTVQISGKQPFIMESLGGLHFKVSPAAFFQVHTEAAERLVQTLQSATHRHSFLPPFRSASRVTGDVTSSDRLPGQPLVVLDVCCGTGTLGLTLCKFDSNDSSVQTRLLGVERCAAAVNDARDNARLNGLDSPLVHFIASDAEDVIEQLLQKVSDLRHNCGADHKSSSQPNSGLPPYVVAIVDPPRTGLKPSVCAALRAQPLVRRVLYVSCNPAGRTMRNDFAIKGGSLLDNTLVLCGPCKQSTSSTTEQHLTSKPFRPAFAQAIDMFPDTPHCELVLAFVR